jgi:membrane associated rhomboid family serine protease
MLVFGLIGFLVPAGFLEKRPVPIVISVIVAVMYGWTFFTGLLPISHTISELAHFYGGITGVALAFLVARAPGEKHEDAPLEAVTREIL